MTERRAILPDDAIADIVRVIEELRDVPGDIAECGAYRCGTTIVLAKHAAPKRVYAFDVFGGSPYNDGSFGGFENADITEIFEFIKDFKNITLVQGKHEQTIPEHAPPTLSLLIIDSDHYASAIHCLTHLVPRISPGGVVLIDDKNFDGISRAVSEQFPDRQMIDLPSGLGRINP